MAISSAELADLLIETGHRHHAAYAESDGADPEWALWYAGYLQAVLWDRAGDLPSRSLLVYLLVRGDREIASGVVDRPWNEHYAGLILDELGPS